MTEWDDPDRESVLEDLASSNEEVRRLAVERADFFDLEQIFPRLIERLGDSDWRVRKAAVRRVVAHPDAEEVARRLLDALADGENPGRRNAAVEALVELGERALPSLIASCAVEDADVRKFVVDALAGVGSIHSVDVLVQRLEDVDANVRAAAADALGAVGGAVAREALRATAVQGDEDALVRFSALHALDTLEEPLRSDELATVLSDPVLGPAGLALLGRCDDPGALDALLKGLASGIRAARESSMRAILRLVAQRDGAEVAAVRERLAALVDSEPVIASSAIERLADSDLGTQLALVQFLALVGSREAVIPILEAGRDEALAPVAIGALEEIGAEVPSAIDAAWGELDIERRCAACEVLGRVGGKRSLARLLAVLEDPDPSLRTAAARALSTLGAESALAPLVRRLQHVESEESYEGEEETDAIAEAIVSLAGASEEGAEAPLTGQAVELLAAALNGASNAARLSIARVLGAIARDRDAELVAMLLKDPSPEVRCAAVDAVARLEADRTPEPLHLAIADEAPGVRVAAARALGVSRHETVFDDLQRLADDEDSRVRAEAVGAIGRRFASDADPRVRVAALAELNRACEDEAPVALAVVESAYETGGDSLAYVTPLLSRSEPEIVIGTVRCLGAHAPDTELEALLPLVSHADWSVRAEAVETLGVRGFRRAVPTILRRMETEQDDFVRSVTLNALQKLEG